MTIAPAPTARAFASLRTAAILGAQLPSDVLTSDAVACRLGVDEDWIVKRTGIHERRCVAPSEHTSDLATIARAACARRRGLEANDVDLVLVDVIPASERAVYDVREVARMLADGGGIVELDARWARNVGDAGAAGFALVDPEVLRQPRIDLATASAEPKALRRYCTVRTFTPCRGTSRRAMSP